LFFRWSELQGWLRAATGHNLASRGEGCLGLCRVLLACGAMIRAQRTRFGLGRRLTGWIAAYAFVLHAVLAGAVVAQFAAGAPAPGIEICLDHPDGVPSPAQGQHQHDQCALHCAAALGFAALAVALIAILFQLRPLAYAPRRTVHRAPTFPSRAGLSRAPPLTA
jgi:hypothetical protein